MKQKLFTLLLAVAAGVGTMLAERVQIGDLYYNLFAFSRTAEVTFQNSGKLSGDIVIPSSVTYNSVSYSVTSIGKSAFAGCTGLTSVTIPNSVTSIGEWAFEGCSGLTSVTIGNSVTSIGESAFWGCSGLTSVTIGNSVTSIGKNAFYNCSGLTSVTIPNSVTSIGEYAFSGCTGLPVIDNIRYADAYLVEAVDKTLSTYTIKEGTRFIGNLAFYNCSGLTSVTIPNSVTSIGNHAFESCSGLTSVTIPNSVTSIGNYAFAWCGMASVTIGNNVTSIGGSAFSGCTGLTSVTIPNSVTSIGESAFWGCSGLTSVTIGNSVTSIGERAFEICTGLTSVTIPNSVTSIGEFAFSGCSINTINFKGSIEDWCNKTWSPSSISGNYQLRLNGVIQENINIPNSVTSIGDNVFRGCTGLTSVTIPNSVTSIGGGAFYNCSGLTSVTIPGSVTSIGNNAFDGCTGLNSITCEAITPPTLGSRVFSPAFIDSKIPLYVPAGSIDLYKAAYQWKNFTNILPISAQETETTSVQAEPTDNSVSVSWPQVSGAASYELEIKDKDGNVVCTLIFNAQGQLTSIAFNAPSRDGAPQQTQTAGFQFTITGLESGTDYDFTITAKDDNGSVLNTENGSFKTTGESQGFDEVQTAKDANKILRYGQILILRGDKMYTLTGQEVR